MIEYARISQMIDYQKRGFWPLGKFSSTERTTFRSVLEDTTRIVLHKGPIKSTHMKHVVPVPTEVFRMGTRGWEYPWVAEIIKSSLSPGAKVLDCGCGVNGFPLQVRKSGFEAFGLDYFVGRSSERRGYGLPDSYIKKHSAHVKFLNGGMEKIPAENDSFDATTCISVMEHVVIGHKEDPSFHIQCLDEMARVLRPGGLMICTYDTILDAKAVYGGKHGWGKEGWFYKSDIEHLLGQGMEMLEDRSIFSREDILKDQDAFFIPPDFYFAFGYGSGFEDFGRYHRLTSVGFVLKKKKASI